MPHETVCIRRHGFSLLHTEGADFAAKVTYHAWEPGRAGTDIRCELLIPLAPELDRGAAIELAKSRHRARCRALWAYWQNTGPLPDDADYSYEHGAFRVGPFRIIADEYAPGPTYSVD